MRSWAWLMLAITVLALASPATGQAADGHVWQRYTNARFGYTLCYPADLLHPQGESPNGDGQRFVADDGAVLLVYARFNVLDETLRAIVAETGERLAGGGGKVTHQTLRAERGVVSGVSGREVFYARVQIRRDQVQGLELNYAQARAGVYDRIATRLSACFSNPEK